MIPKTVPLYLLWLLISPYSVRWQNHILEYHIFLYKLILLKNTFAAFLDDISNYGFITYRGYIFG